MADDRRLDAEIIHPLLPASPYGRVVLGVGGHAPDVEGAEGGGRGGRGFLTDHGIAGAEHGEDDIMAHHVKVPGDDGALVLVLDQDFVHLLNIKRGDRCVETKMPFHFFQAM